MEMKLFKNGKEYKTYEVPSVDHVIKDVEENLGEEAKQKLLDMIKTGGIIENLNAIQDTMAKRIPLKVNKRLPKIILPKNKLKMFSDWWDTDIKHETFVPHSFEEGYLLIDNEDAERPIEDYKEIIKEYAKDMHTTYRYVEKQFSQFIQDTKQFTVYFKFINNDTINLQLYGNNNYLFSNINAKVGMAGKGMIDYDLSLKDLDITEHKTMESMINVNNYRCLVYFVTCMWYMATTAPSTRYIYEEKHPVIEHRHKRTVHVSDTKFIVTPVYDFSKVRTTTVERLVTRKKGWTYSHSFQVHGHYRHYKDGRTIFIESYIKGKGKPFKAQTTILSPDKIKEE